MSSHASIPDHRTPRRVARICSECAGEIFFHSLFDWWACERLRILEKTMSQHGNDPAPIFAYSSGRHEDDNYSDEEEDEDDERSWARGGGSFPTWVIERQDCPDGRSCVRQAETSE
jgi:hypothetical protein